MEMWLRIHFQSTKLWSIPIFEPVLFAFNIKAFNKKDSLNPATVIEVDPLFTKDVNALGMPERYRKQYKVSRLDGERSYIETIKSYPFNVEARHVKTYAAKAPPSNQTLGFYIHRNQ